MREENLIHTDYQKLIEEIKNVPDLTPGFQRILESMQNVISGKTQPVNALEHQLAKLLKESVDNAHRAGLFTFSPSACLTLDIEGRISDINLRTCGIIGLSEDQIIGRLLADFIDEQSRNELNTFLHRVSVQQGPDSCFVNLVPPGQSIIALRIDGIVYPGSPLCHAVLTDISEQKRAEALLHNNEDQLDTLFQLAVDAILLGSPEGNITNANKHALELSGYSFRELIGKPINILFDDSELDRVPFQYEKLKAGKIVRNERFLRRKDGSRVPIEMNTKMMPDRSYQSFIRDMTVRRKMEDALRASEKKFSEAFKTSPDSININRASDGIYIEVNDGFCAITGYTPEEVLGKSSYSKELQLWVNTEDRDKMITELRSKGEITGFEAAFRMKDGTIRFGLMSARFITISNEECIISTTRDITQRKMTEKTLLESEKSYRGILNTVSESIYILDAEGRFVDVNDGATKMYGYSQEEFIGRTFHFVSAPGMNDEKAITGLVKTTMETGIQQQFEFWGIRKNGDFFPKEVICNRGIYFGDTVIIATARDITERKRNEDVLIAARKKAEESERLKSAFLANMSHEIRSPMNSIVGFSDLLDDDELPADQRQEFITIIRNSGKQLLTIINDIIDFAKIDSNQLTISPSEIHLNRMLDDLMLALEVDKKNLRKDELKLLVEKELPDERCLIITDEVRLKQILINLTGNALKFTTKGHIKVGYSMQQNHIRFYVEDTGKGIAPNKQQIIFERFRQEEESYTRLYGGTGLGLSISKGLVELLGGKITLESEPGRGSTFSFTLPISIWTGYAQETEQPVIQNENYDFRGKTILIAEDIFSNFRLIKHMLKKSEARVLYAEDGQKAVEICREDPNIDLILMDIQMPVMNGLEATIEIRKFRPGLPVIALTAFSLSEDSGNCFSAGCVDYLTKPIDKSSMLMKVNQYIHG